MLLLLPAAIAVPTATTPTGAGSARPEPALLDGSTPTLSTEIVNGQRERGYGAVVALHAPEYGVFCTAAMITPRLALTAAHCVWNETLQPEELEADGEIRWGPNADNPTQTARIVAVTPHPLWDPFAHSFADLAVVEIEPVEHTELVWIVEEPLPPSFVGTILQTAGYGDAQDPRDIVNRKRFIEVEVTQLISDVLVTHADANPTLATSPCHGDSGGSLFRKSPEGRLLSAGVWSRGDGSCAGYTLATRTPDYARFILEHVARVHGSDDMCDNRAASTDGICDPECPDDPVCTIHVIPEAKGCQTGSTPPGWAGVLVLSAVFGGRRTRHRR